MKLIILLLCVLSANGSTLHLVYVSIPGETFTTAEQQQALVSTQRAVDWWNIPTNIITSTLVLTQTDALTNFDWQRQRAVVSDDITIYVIDNSNSHRLLFGDSAGEAQEYYKIAAVVLYGLPGEKGLEATITHELGHILYHLDDQPQGLIDIMGDTATAYRMHFIGCASLAAMGKPCQTTYLPMLSTH